jgi:nitrogen fixation protein FixH
LNVQFFYGGNVCLFPHFLPFFFAHVFALVNLVMAFKAQRSHQIVVSLNAPTFATTPICVRRLHHVARPTGLAIKTRYQLQQFF